MLIRLIYVSTVGAGIGLPALNGILQQSQANNMRADLTGMLAFSSQIVLQALEGDRDRVNALYTKLLRDDRHHTVVMLKYQEVQERLWPAWSMGFTAPTVDGRAVFLKHSTSSTFNPYGMGADAVEKMLLDMAGKTIAMGATPEGTQAAQPQAQPRIKPIATVPSPEYAALQASASAARRPVGAGQPAARSAPRKPAEKGLFDRLFGR
ncbi:MAG: hypothetical protein NVS2B4_07520 [Ramlibacter sp.]